MANAKKHIQQRKKVRQTVSSAPENNESASAQYEQQPRLNNISQLV